jgi:hypothetical protein
VTEYSDWEFLLDGDTQEFRNLAHCRGTRLFDIYGGVDEWLDCPNDDFRMTTLYCDGETNPNVAWQVGNELISLFNGASLLFKKDYRKTSIYKVLYNGHEATSSPSQGGQEFLIHPALLGSPECSPDQLAEEVCQAKALGIKFQLIHLATENQDVYFILKYLDMEAGWATYYKLLEAIDFFARKNSVDLAITDSRRRSFASTANNFSLSGFDSRHGFKELAKANNTACMSIGEGYMLVVEAAKRYLKKMYFS